MLTEIALTFFTLLLIVAFLIRRNNQYWSKHGFPCVETSSPWKLFINVRAQAAMVDLARKIYVDYPNEKFIGYWLMMKPALLIRDPKLIRNVFISDSNYFNDRGIYHNPKVDPLSGNLIALNGAKWKSIRVKMTPAFSSGKLKNMFSIFSDCAGVLNSVIDDQIQKDEEIELRPLFQRFSADIISQTAFGIDADALHQPNSPFLRYTLTIFQQTLVVKLKNTLSYFAPEISKMLKVRVIPRDVEDFFMTSIKKTINLRKESQEKRSDLVDIFMQLKAASISSGAEGDNAFDDNDIVAQAFTFFAAGFETTSSTLTWVIYELAKHQDMQQRVREEVTEILEQHDNVLSYDALSDMKYMGKVIDECLRIYPVARMLTRVGNADYPIPDTNLVIPKGVRVATSVYGLHFDPQYFPDPQKFDPERFTEEAKNNRPSCVYLPFGEGPRICIGKRFALLEIKVALVNLLSNFRFDVTEKTTIPMVFNPAMALLQPKDKLYLKVTRI